MIGAWDKRPSNKVLVGRKKWFLPLRQWTQKTQWGICGLFERDSVLILPVLHDYALATSQAVQEWVATLTPEDLERPIDTPIGELKMGQMLEAFIIWHINVHCGEISALKGYQGLKGYIW